MDYTEAMVATSEAKIKVEGGGAGAIFDRMTIVEGYRTTGCVLLRPCSTPSTHAPAKLDPIHPPLVWLPAHISHHAFCRLKQSFPSGIQTPQVVSHSHVRVGQGSEYSGGIYSGEIKITSTGWTDLFRMYYSGSFMITVFAKEKSDQGAFSGSYMVHGIYGSVSVRSMYNHQYNGPSGSGPNSCDLRYLNSGYKLQFKCGTVGDGGETTVYVSPVGCEPTFFSPRHFEPRCLLHLDIAGVLVERIAISLLIAISLVAVHRGRHPA